MPIESVVSLEIGVRKLNLMFTLRNKKRSKKNSRSLSLSVNER